MKSLCHSLLWVGIASLAFLGCERHEFETTKELFEEHGGGHGHGEESHGGHEGHGEEHGEAEHGEAHAKKEEHGEKAHKEEGHKEEAKKETPKKVGI